jgi:hypothetical protein
MAKHLNLEISLMSKNKQTQREEIDPDDFLWTSLGLFADGVRNEEGYSKRFIYLGSRRGSLSFKNYHMSEMNRKVVVVQVSEKFYYTNSSTHHHEDVDFFEWSGNIKDYIDKRYKGGIRGGIRGGKVIINNKKEV